MISKTLKLLTILVLVSTVGGIAVLSVWDIPVEQASVEKKIEISEFLDKE